MASLAFVALAFASGPAVALEFWVDATTGNDARSPIQAQSKATPWKTIVHALETVTSGHAIHVRPGTYAERLESEAAGVSLVADGAPGSVVIASAPGATGLLVTHADVSVSGFAFAGGLRGVRSIAAPRLVLRDVRVSGHSGDGIFLETSPASSLERVAVAGGALGIGIVGSPGAALLDVSVSGALQESLSISTSPEATLDGVELVGGTAGLRLATSESAAVRHLSIDRAGRSSGDGLSLESSPGSVLEGVEVTGGARAIVASSCADLVLRDAAVSGHAGTGLLVQSSPRSDLDGIAVDGGGAGVRIDGSPDSGIADASVSGHSGAGIEVAASPRTRLIRAAVEGGTDAFAATSSDGVSIGNVTATGHSGVGIAVSLVAVASVAEATVDGGTVGFRADGAGGLDVSDLAVSGFASTGVDVDASPEASFERVAIGPAPGLRGFTAALSDALELRDATIAGASTSPIAIETSAGAVLERVSVAGGLDALVADRCAGLRVVDFAAAGHSGAGAVVTVSPGASIDGVTLDRGTSGVRVSSSDGATVRRATIERVTGVALSIAGSTSPMVDGAVIRSVGEGLDVSNGPGAIVRGVAVSGVVGIGAAIASSPSVRVEDCSFEEGSYGLRVQGADDVAVIGVVATGSRVAGISVSDSSKTVVANSVVRDAGGQGIVVERGAPAYVRNNLVADASGWGIVIDDEALPEVGTGHVVAFNTVVRSGAAAGAGGLLLANAIGEVRDNLLSENSPIGLRIDTPGAIVHHDLVWGSPEPVSPEGYGIGGGMVYADPGFASGDAAHPFALSQVAAGQGFDSPAVDVGSAGVVSRDVGGSTRTDLVEDEGFADLGFHAGAPAPGEAPAPVRPTTLWVNCATGDDLRGRGQADSSLSPLLTISRALSIAVEGDRIVVQDGTCAERATIDVPGVSLEAENAGGVVIEAPADQAAIRVRASRVNVFGFVVRSAKEGVVVASKNSSTRLLLVRVRNLRVEGAGGGPGAFVATNGIRLSGVDRSRVESCEIRRALGQGIVAQDAGRMWIRNNLVVNSGEWGIHVDDGDRRPAIPSGNLVLFNTVVGSGEGGIRFQRATGEIGWNISAFNVGPGIKVDDGPVWIHHANLFENAVPIFSEPASPPVVWSLVPGDPLFVDRAAGDFALRQVEAGQDADSPAVDAAGVRPGKARIKGSTRTDGIADDGMADLGWHATRKKLGSRPVLVVPPDDEPRTLHVDAALGDDGRSALDAVDPATPWRTIARAFRAGGARTGDTVRVAAGTYEGGIATIVPGVALRGIGAVTVLAPTDGAGVSVGHADVSIEGLRIEGGRRGIAAGGAAGLVVRDVAVVGTKKDAIVLESSPGSLLERVHVEGGNALVRATGSEGVVVRDLDAGDHEAEGIVLAGSANALLERISVTGGRTVVSATTSPGVVARDLVASAIRGDGVVLDASPGARLERLTLGARDVALRVVSSADLVVSRLDASGHEAEGIVLAGSANALLERISVTGGRTVVSATTSPGVVARDLVASAIRGDGVVLDASPGARLERLTLGARDVALRVVSSADLVVSRLDASGHEDEGVVVSGSDRAALEDVSLEGGSRGFVLSAGAHMRIERARLDGARGGVVADVAAALVVRDLAMTGLATTAVSLTSSPDAALERVSAAGGEDAVVIAGSPGVEVTDLSVSGASGAAVVVTSSDHVRIEDVGVDGATGLVAATSAPALSLADARATGLSGHAVALHSSADSTIADVVTVGGIDALRATLSPRLAVDRFEASGHAGAGIRVESGESSRLADVSIEGGTVGVDVSLSPDVSIARLAVANATASGVDLASSPRAQVLVASVDGGARGLRVSGGGESAVEDLSVAGVTGDGVSVATSPGTRVERLQVTGAGGEALLADASADLVLRDLVATGHAGSAVRLTACPGALVEEVAAVGGTHGMRADGVDGVVVRDSSFEGPSTDGLLLAGAVGAVVDGVLVEDAGGSGIALERASGVYLRNNRVARVGDWGISIDDATLPAPSVRDGNVVAFNTVWQAARFSSTSGGIRFVAASGEIRDNVVVAVGGSIVKTDLAPTVVHHNVLFGGARTFDSKSGEEPVRRANRVADPLLVDPAASDFSLRQVAAGQGADSPARDAGSGRVAVLDIGGSTRTDAVSDEGLADAGWHAGADAAGTRPAIAFVAPPGLGNTLHADAVAGDDERGYDQAQEGATPVRSARRAMALAQPGDVVVLEPGTYAESIEVPADGVVLRGSGARGAVIVQPPDGETGIEVAGHDDVTIENLVVEGGSRGLLATDSDRLRLFRVGSVVPEFVGLEVRDGTDAIVDSCFATGAGSHGVQLRRASGYLRNNLVYANGEWGLSVDASGLPSPLAGVVVAFNTVHANQDGIRMVNAGGEVRDNLLTEQVDLGLYLAGPNLLVHHNDFSANGRDRDQESAFVDTIRVWASIDGNPRYRDPSGPDDVLGLEGWADDDFRLRQLPGETPASPMVDAGSGPVGALDVGGSTRSDGLPDSGTADLGVHVDAPPATVPPPFATPPGVVASTYYVSSATGFDGRSSATARRRETPWATIGRALQAVEPGDSIVVLPGRYPATVQVGVPEVSIVSETRHAAVVAPVSGNGVSIEADDVTVSGFVVEDAQNNGVSVLDGADRAEVRDCALVRSRANGLLAKGVSGLVVEDVISVSSGQSGIVLRNTTGSTLRDVLSYENGEWGANVNSVVTGVVSGGHLVERGTFAFNALGGVRFAKAAGTIRDNLLTDTPGVGLRIDTAGSTLLHNGFFADAQEMDPATYILAQCSGCAANLVLDPVFVDPDGADGVRGGLGWADDDFRLSQVAAGQATQSEAVDAGSVGVDSLGPVGTTRTDGEPDLGTLDLGVHR